MPFVHLHNHSEYSIADGLFSPKKWAEALESKGFYAHALTDHGTMAGILPFYKTARERGIIPIVGCEFYFCDEPELKVPDNRDTAHLVLLAKDYDGYQNLLKLQKLSYTDGFYFRPRIGIDWLSEYYEGLVCLTACLGGILAKELWKERDLKLVGRLEQRYKQLHGIFGNDLYVEFQGHDADDQKVLNRAYFDRLRDLPGFSPVITNDCHYVLPEHAKIQDMLKASAYKRKSDDAGQSYTKFDSLWLKRSVDIARSFFDEHDLPREFVLDAMKRTDEIVDKCKGFELPEGKRYLPKYTADSKDQFRKITTQLLADFLKQPYPASRKTEYVERFKKEYRVISKYNLEDYFLIVADIVKYALDNGIYVGLGRGSAAGCLISYLLGIVRIDPIRFDLIFERFLNEHRCSGGELPDIDVDFESARRDEIKAYVVERFGADHVCEIGTYGRIQLKTGILDFGGILEVGSRSDLLRITKNLEAENFAEAMADSETLQGYVNKKPEFGFAVSEIIGQVKSQGVHPAGLLLSDVPIATITPVKSQKSGSERVVVTQAEDKYLIEQGLIKLDVLGIKEYDQIKFVLENAPGCEFTMRDYVEKILDDEDQYQIDGLNPVHRKVWHMFSTGRTDGVFQFSSDVMKALLIDMKPDELNDLIAANALVRPGCLENGWHIDYCNRKRDPDSVTYVHDDLKSVLSPTYGIIVYQEQTMEVFHKLGGIPLVDADTIRSALGKKDKAKLAKFKDAFIAGAGPKLGSKLEAEEIWEQIEKASSYLFNKSHSAAYSVLGFISQYCKVRWPLYFWAAALEWDVIKGVRDSMLTHKKAAAVGGIEFVYPNVNASCASFQVEDEKIVWSLSSVKGVGVKAAQEIESKFPFIDFDDFYERVDKSKVRWNNIVNLTYAGAFDEIGDRRDILRFMYSLKSAKKKTMPDLTDAHFVMEYHEMMGFFEQSLKKVFPFSGDLFSQADVTKLSEGYYCGVGGIVTDVHKIKTKAGDTMAFISVSDVDEEMTATAFPAQWLKFARILEIGSLVELWGTKNEYQGRENQIVLDNVVSVEA